MHSNGDNFNSFASNPNQNNLINGNIGMSSQGSGMAGMSGMAPPLPPRPNQIPTNGYRLGNNYGFGQQFGNYSNYSSMCSPFNGYGFGGYGLNRFNNNYSNNGNESHFVRIAEESSRQAFQSIESIVQAFGSVSMMLESTYYAVHSSFRAVIGVADHFSRLRQHLVQILSTLAIIRSFKWIIRRILTLIGVRRLGAEGEARDERAWSQAFNDSSNPIESHLTADGTFDSLRADSTADLVSRGRSSWPIIIFFSVIFGTPWLIWRLLSSITGADTTASNQWMTGNDGHFEATALYDFQTDAPRELAFTTGQRLIVAPKELQPRVRGWLLATIDGKKEGLIPANYVRIVGFRSPKGKQ